MASLRTLSYLLIGGALVLQAEAPNRPARAEGVVRKSADEPGGLGGDRSGRRARPESEKDDAAKRSEAMREWYGGDWSPEYRQFILEAAARERRANGHLLQSAVNGSSWTNLGPTNAASETNGSTLNVRDSGRPVSIVVDPNNASIIYLATAGGGLWKTTDGGATWAPKTETLGSLSCGFLAMDPTNSQVLYLGLGDAFDGTGIGLVKSTDGGATWSAPVYLGNATSIRDVQVCPQATNVLLASTNVGLFRSTDSGATWSAVSLPTGSTATPVGWQLAYGGSTNWALTVEADTSQTAGSGAIFYSSDNGATWTKATGFTNTRGIKRASIASAPSNRSVMYAMASSATPFTSSDPSTDIADIYKSTDAGHTWTALNVTAKSYSNTNSESSSPKTLLGGQGFYNHLIMVDRSNPNIAYFGGQLLLAKTTDGGSTFSQMTNWLAQYSLPYVHADFHCGTIDQNGTLYVGTDGGIFKQTSASSNTWTSDLNIGIASHLIYSVGSSLNNRSAVIGGFQDNGTRVRSGATSTFNQPIGGDGFGSHIHATNAQQMLGSLYYTRVYKSTDGGSTFSAASSGITESNNSSTGVFTTRIVPGLADTTGNTVYTFSNGKVYKSTNYAGSWTAMGTSGLPAGGTGSSSDPSTALYIRNVGAAKSNASVVGIVANQGRVYLTANAGSTWTAAAALPNSGNSLSYIWFDTTNYNTVYVASVAADQTKNHLWKSTNFGSSWTALDGSATASNGLPFGIPVNAVQTDPGDVNTLYAGTHLGVYKSSDAGATWSRFGSGMPLVNVTDFYIAPDSSLMRASTFGRGFWELNITAGNTVTASVTAPSADQTVATGTSVSFTGTATDSSSTATLSYAWDFGDGTTGTGASASHTFTNTGSAAVTRTVKFTATDNTGASGSATRLITVNPPAAALSASITAPASNQTVNSGASVSFTGAASGGTSPYSYSWNFGDGTTGTGASTSHTFTNTGTTAVTRTVTLTTTDNVGATATATRSITVNPQTTSTTLAETESNNTIGTANVVASTVTSITGNLPATTDVDYFAITLQPGQKITINMTGPTGPDWDLYLKNSAGTTLASSTGSTTTESLSYTNSGSTAITVYANVTCYATASSSNYTLAMSYVTPPPSSTYTEVESNNSISAANAVPDTATKITGYIGTTTDDDYFAVNVGAGKTLSLSMTGPTGTGYDYDLYVYNAAGTTLTSSTGSTTTESASWTNSGASTATVYVAVKHYAGSSTTTPYNVSITR